MLESPRVFSKKIRGVAIVGAVSFAALTLNAATIMDLHAELFSEKPSPNYRALQLNNDAQILDMAKANLVYVPQHLLPLNGRYFPLEYNMPDLPPGQESFPHPLSAKSLIAKVMSDVPDMGPSKDVLYSVLAGIPSIQEDRTMDIAKYKDDIASIEHVRQFLVTRSQSVEVQSSVEANRQLEDLKARWERIFTAGVLGSVGALGLSFIPFSVLRRKLVLYNSPKIPEKIVRAFDKDPKWD